MSTKIEFAVQMTCDGCVNAIKDSLTKQSGIKNVEVDLKSKTVVVDTTLSTAVVQQLLESTGRKVVVKGYGGTQAGVAILEFGEKTIHGVVRFVQTNPDTCIIDGTIDGLQPGKHGLAVYECGDTSDGCASVGNFYNPADKTKTGRIYGNLGEVVAGLNGRAEFRLQDNVLKLSDIIGRALVITESVKDNIPFGRRLACGIIARSSGLFENPKTICACDGVTIWDERVNPKSVL